MRFGICCGSGSFVPSIQAQPLSPLPRLMETMQEAGADYVEFGVGSVLPDAEESEFEKLRELLTRFPLRPEAFNSFIPAHLRITGPDVNLAAVLSFCRIALTRCQKLGGEVVVLGSGAARKVAPGYDPAAAENQFIEFCRKLGAVAADAGITVALEPLNTKEDNLLVSVKHGAMLVDAIAHPRIQLLADLYHMSQDNEPVSNAADAGKRLCHTHLADLGRVAPGFAPAGEENFIGFFRALRKAGYDKRCSFEGSFANIETQSKPVLALLRKRWAESAE